MACHALCPPESLIQGIHINFPHGPLPAQLKYILLQKTRTGTSDFAALKHNVFRESSVIRRKSICFAQPSDSERDPLSSDITPPTADASLPVKLAWYGSEVFGRAVALLRGNSEKVTEVDEEFGAVVEPDVAREALKQDYARNYFVTGDMTLGIYEEQCEFADPFVSFKGRDRFKANVSNLGSFMEEVNLKVLTWEETADGVNTEWRFSCVLGLPWRPILAASGGTQHFFDKRSGKIYKHVERWDISPADGVRQLFKPNPRKKTKAPPK